MPDRRHEKMKEPVGLHAGMGRHPDVMATSSLSMTLFWLPGTTLSSANFRTVVDNSLEH